MFYTIINQLTVTQTCNQLLECRKAVASTYNALANLNKVYNKI